MKRKLFTIVTAMVSFLLVGVMVAQAVDFKFSGQIRPRWELNEQGFGAVQNDFDDFTDPNVFFSTRVRFNVDATIDDNTSVFLQFQSAGVWGSCTTQHGTGCTGNTSTQQRGDGNRGGFLNVNDQYSEIGLHQAYFKIKNFFTAPLELKIGRQEIVIDGHRLLGHTGWLNGAHAHDAIRLTHARDNYTLNYSFIRTQEDARARGGTSASDRRDIDAHVVYGAMKGILGGQLSLIFVGVEDDSANDDDTRAHCNTPGVCDDDTEWFANNIYTAGIRQAGQMFGIDYRAEFYYQWGDAEGQTRGGGIPQLYVDAGGQSNTDDWDESGVDRDAYMFGVRVGKKFNSVWGKPSVTAWYDHLSGLDDGDLEDNDWGAFNTLFDTGHKFYGFMDVFLPANGAGTSYLGLQDLAFKFAISPMAKLTVKADIHSFWTETDLANGIPDRDGPNWFLTHRLDHRANNDNNDTDWGSFLGNELDITVIYKYSPAVKISAGFSHFWADNLFHIVSRKSAGVAPFTNDFTVRHDDEDGNLIGDDASWAYIQMDVRF